MPELPEVEVTRRRIRDLLVGRRIAAVHTTGDSYFFLTRPARLRRGLVGRRVESLERQGKYLLAGLDDEQRLLIHLGMTGQLFTETATSPRLLSATARSALTPREQIAFRPDEHTHLQLEFEDGGPRVLLRDVRKFGKVRLLARGARELRLERLGVDALRAVGEDLFRASRKRKVAIKSLLLSQSVVAGIGNIYADEALFLAGIRPTRRAGRLTRRDCERLMTSVRRVLERSIETGGSSISDYVAPDGTDGGYQDERHVYGLEGQPCSACDTPIRRVVLGQRGAHFCPQCQS
jgi:formamidopyrimidine-DNA glycosylase